MTNEIVAIIVTYNRKELLKESILSLFEQTYKDLSIYIIDNASTDGTSEYLNDILNDNRVYYFNTGMNLGGAGGFSFGIKEAVKNGFSYLWIMDDDTLPQPTALEELLNAKNLLKDDFGFLCSDVRWTDGNPCAMNIPNISKHWVQHSNLIKDGLLRVEQCSFVSCFFTSKVVREIGLPFKEFFVWGDDAEYTKRISDIYPSYFVSKSIVTHKMNSNIPTDISLDSPDRLFRYQFSYRNMYYVNRKQGNKLSMLLYRYGILLDIKKICKSSQKGKWKKIKIILKSVRAGKKFNPEVEYLERENDETCNINYDS